MLISNQKKSPVNTCALLHKQIGEKMNSLYTGLVPSLSNRPLDLCCKISLTSWALVAMKTTN